MEMRLSALSSGQQYPQEVSRYLFLLGEVPILNTITSEKEINTLEPEKQRY
jgi:hypothetical protein